MYGILRSTTISKPLLSFRCSFRIVGERVPVRPPRQMPVFLHVNTSNTLQHPVARRVTSGVQTGADAPEIACCATIELVRSVPILYPHARPVSETPQRMASGSVNDLHGFSTRTVRIRARAARLTARFAQARRYALNVIRISF
jgi:hypothetical protein